MTSSTGRDRLSLIVFSGNYDRVHYAFVMASAAAATNRPVTMFFTMGGIRALLARRADSAPGWAALAPADNGESAVDREAAHARAGVATLEELIQACTELDVTMRVCEMGLVAEGLSSNDFRTDVTVTVGGMVSFLAEAENDNGRIVFI
ncbi:MAG: DsrE/DsrF/DrsH-like family protein [Proteobacteria bacterium]|nr:DsrE/DsrF/DrsH-like family protein [Pseudomonadota bacterium]MDA1323258.1 DsrE/DsrF/DrsH-like family protein [Pseudomonadota bacterium]